MDRRISFVAQVLPPLVFLLLTGLSIQDGSRRIIEPPLLLPLLQTLFAGILPLFVAALAAWSYVAQGAGVFLLLGCALLAPLPGTLLSAWGLPMLGINYAVTVHNVGWLAGGMLHLASAGVLSLGSARGSDRTRERAVLGTTVAFAAVALATACVSVLAVRGLTPTFFVPGIGGTVLRQAVLSTAATCYAVSGMIILGIHGRTGLVLLSLYADALFLCAIGLAGALALHTPGTSLAWVSRAAVCVGNVFFVMAILVGRRETGARVTSIPAYLTELFRSKLEGRVRERTSLLIDLNLRLHAEVEERRRAEEQLRRSEERMRQAGEATGLGIFEIDHEAGTGFATPEARAIFGLGAEESIPLGEDWVPTVAHEADVGLVREALRKASDPRGSGVLEVEFRITRGDGATRWIRARSRTVFSGDNPARPLRTNGTVQDVTEWKVIARKVKDTEEAYRTLVDSAQDGLAIVRGGRTLFANPALARITGYTPEELVAMTTEENEALVHPEDLGRFAQQPGEGVVYPGPPGILSFRIRRKDGTVRDIEAQMHPVEYDGAPALEVAYRDVSEVKAARDALGEAHRKMRNLAAHLLRAREEERRKVAQEIHDELGQILAALKMDLHWLRKRVREGPEAVVAKVDSMIDLGERTIAVVQRISSDLRPKMLDDLGLEPALDWLASDFQRRTQVDCSISVSVPPGMIGGNTATILYRVVQEALSNVGRHSRARKARVQLERVDGCMELRVEDDGIGITPAQCAASDSFGIIGMHERVEGIGGTVVVAGQPGKGTAVTARIPLPAEGGLA